MNIVHKSGIFLVIPRVKKKKKKVVEWMPAQPSMFEVTPYHFDQRQGKSAILPVSIYNLSLRN